MGADRSVRFFDEQFRRQIEAGDFALNPFERAALPYLAGRVLDLGCGLGNLSLEAARRGCTVTAVDASASAIERLRALAVSERLKLDAVQAGAESYPLAQHYNTAVAIGLVMFFPCPQARQLLGALRGAVAPGGRVVVNALVEGTTWLEPFEPGSYCLLAEGEIERAFADWTILLARRDQFPAPGGTLKRFETVIAQRP